MLQDIELEIQNMLTTLNEPALVADEFLKRWHRDELEPEDIGTLAQFLIIFGFHAALCENIARRIKENKSIPWASLASLLAELSEAPSKEVVDQLLIGAGEQRGLEDFTRIEGITKIDPRIEKIRQEFSTERKNRFKTRKQDLLNQADLYKNDLLFDKERAVLEKLMFTFPGDATVMERFAEFSTRQARKRLQRKSSANWEEQLLQREKLNPEALAAAEDITKKWLKTIKKNKKHAYDKAIALMQMGYFDGALQIIEHAPKNVSTDWLKVEILLAAHKYLIALSFIDEVERKYAQESETAFSAMYARAKALWGLNQGQAAIDLLESLVKVRPDYRSSYSLLQSWKEVIE